MDFWELLNLTQKIYFCIGLAASLFLVLQIITLLFGFGDTADADVDFSADADVDLADIDVESGDADALEVADGFNLFTFRGFIAFFAIGGWTGYALASINVILAVFGSLLAGSLALVAMAFMMKAIMRLRSSGNIDIGKSVGMLAEVYLTIPAKNNGAGKINLTLEERFVELAAISESEEPIPTGSTVKIVGVLGDKLIVEKA